MKKNLFISKIAVFIVVFFAFFFTSCKEKTPEAVIPQYKCLTLSLADGEPVFEFATTTQSAQVIEVRPRVEGYLDKIYLKEGSRVKKGDPLFLINQDFYNQDLLSAEANVLVAEADLDNAELEVQKVTPLVEKNIVSAFQLQTAKSNVRAAEAQLTKAKAQKRQAEINLDYTLIKSSANGVISQINIREGGLVKLSDNEPLTTISADGDIIAYFSINEKIIQQREHNRAFPEAELRLSNGTIYKHKGKIELASGLVDNNTGTILMKAIFPNTEQLLTTGLSGTVLIPIKIEKSILIPKSATYEMLDKTMVVVVNKDQTVTSKSITIIGSQNDSYIIQEGLSAGDIIVVEGVSKLRDGQKINPIIN